MVAPRCSGRRRSTCPRSARRNRRNRDGIDDQQQASTQAALSAKRPISSATRRSEHHGRDRAMAAEFEREFIAENAGGHREHRKQTLRRSASTRRERLGSHDEGPERDEPGPDAVKLEAMRAIAEHESHGVDILEHRREIEQASRLRLRVAGRQQSGRRRASRAGRRR